MRTILPAKHVLVPEPATRVFKGEIFDVYQWEQALFDGSSATFEMLKRPDTLQVFAIKDHKLVVLNEEQPSMGAALYGLPGGRHDQPRETEVEAAQRELKEETGMEFRDWRLVGVNQPYAKIEWFVYYFVATGYEKTGPVHLDAGEKIELELLDYADVMKRAQGESARHLPLEYLARVDSIDALTDLPQFGA